FVFVLSAEAKQKLAPHMAEGNRAKTVAAPANVLVAADTTFYEVLPRTLPHAANARGWFADASDASKLATAHRSAMLQTG
ncbi:nitroreductase family protein, partial [Mycobacterium tuberculosis]|nr:nitroreductase family protein [Mycobacterium tuberculosis]